MTEHTVTIEKEVPIDEALFEETPVDRNDRTRVEVLDRNLVAVEPGVMQWWASHEFELEDTPWRVADVSKGAHGPSVIFEREEEGPRWEIPSDITTYSADTKTFTVSE